jgi:hypothetical protein
MVETTVPGTWFCLSWEELEADAQSHVRNHEPLHLPIQQIGELQEKPAKEKENQS